MLNPTRSFIERHHILMACAVVQSQRSTFVPIRVFNPSAVPVILKRGTVAGILQPATVLEDVWPQPVGAVVESKSMKQFAISVPDHLQMLYAETCGNLPEDSHHRLAQLLQSNGDVFSTGPTDLGRTNLE